MPKAAIQPSPVIADLLRRRREELGLSLRDVEAKSRASGEQLHFTTLARAEKGKVDLGTRRLCWLFRVYDLPLQLASDLLELERSAEKGELKGTLDELTREGLEFWKSGDVKKALARFFAIRTSTPRAAAERVSRQKALLSMAMATCSLGRLALSRFIIEDLLFEPPDPSLLVSVLTQAALCFQGLGSYDGALGFLLRAETLLGIGEHRKRGWVFHEKASVLADLGQFADAKTALAEAVSAYRRAKDSFGEASAEGVRLRVLRERGDWQAMLRAARAARALCTRRGFSRLTAIRGLDEARALRELGRLPEARDVLRGVLAWTIPEDDRIVAFYAHHGLWKTHDALGDDGRAASELRAAEEDLEFVGEVTPETREIQERRARAGATVVRMGAKRAG